jgi:hypothetical protein
VDYFLHRVLRLLVTAKTVPRVLICFALMMEATRSYEAPVLTASHPRRWNSSVVRLLPEDECAYKTDMTKMIGAFLQLFGPEAAKAKLSVAKDDSSVRRL